MTTDSTQLREIAWLLAARVRRDVLRRIPGGG